jgi:hypothetical protein
MDYTYLSSKVKIGTYKTTIYSNVDTFSFSFSFLYEERKKKSRESEKGMTIGAQQYSRRQRTNQNTTGKENFFFFYF